MSARSRGRRPVRIGVQTARSLMAWLVSTALTAGLLAGNASAQVPREDGRWYYQIGGAVPYLGLGADRERPLELGAAAQWSRARVCEFDQRRSLLNHLGDTSRNVYGLNQAIIRTAALGAQRSGLYVLQRSNPGLYDLLLHGMEDGRRRFEAAVRRCRQVHQPRSGTLLEDWLRQPRSHAWAEAALDGRDPVRMVARIDWGGGDEGLVWIQGRRAGGKGQPPIRLVSDLVRAGHRQRRLVNAEGDGGDPLRGLWSDVRDASAWAVALIGDREIRLCSGCQQLVLHLSRGLRNLHHQEQLGLLDRLLAVLEDADWDASLIDELSVPGMGIMISPRVLQALQKEQGADREILAGRLAAEIALARVLEKAWVIRHLLQAGSEEPNVAANGAARQAAAESLQALEAQVGEVLFEHQLRHEVLTGTARLLLERSLARRTGLAEPAPPAVPFLPEPGSRGSLPPGDCT